jgi:hypothetical protein
MQLLDQSAEYYRLREGHERALALAANSSEEREQHLLTAERYAALGRKLNLRRVNGMGGSGLTGGLSDGS